jgi:hypothetical protein
MEVAQLGEPVKRGDSAAAAAPAPTTSSRTVARFLMVSMDSKHARELFPRNDVASGQS